MRSEKGRLAANLAATERYVAEAYNLKIDILAFPEASLTGYIDPEKYPNSVLALDGPEVKRACQMSTRAPGTTLLLGIIERNPNGLPWVSHLVIRDGNLQGVCRKRENVFDTDPMRFASAQRGVVFFHEGLNFGISICADLFNPNVFQDLSMQGAKLIFELAAPGLHGSQENRNWQSGFNWWRGACHEYLKKYSVTNKIWTAAATQAGRTEDEDFPGGAYIFSPDGKCHLDSQRVEEGVRFAEIDLTEGIVREIYSGL